MTKKVALFFFILLVLFAFRLYFKYDIFTSLPNRKCIIAYLEQTYGKEDYRIIYEEFGKTGAAGRHADYIIVEVDGIEFKVSALNKEIIEDTFFKSKADKMLSEALQKQCNNETTVELDYLISCSTFFDVTSEYEKYTSHSEMLNDSNLNISMMICAFSDKPIESIYKDLYELYVFSSKFNVTTITIRLDTSSNKSAYSEYKKERQDYSYYEYNALFPSVNPVGYENFVSNIEKH